MQPTGERWDVTIRVVDGPLANMGPQKLRGPVIRVGANPGPGGLKLAGYRGLADRHLVVTAYDEATASITPVGTCQVRMAPHTQHQWKEIDPMGGTEYLSKGCALHLGPPERGVTLEFLGCEKLGQWTGGGVEASHVTPEAMSTQAIPTSTVPAWFVGCSVLMGAGTLAMIGSLVFIYAVPHEPLGPKIEGDDGYDWVSIDEVELGQSELEGIRQGFGDFVMAPNADQAERERLLRPENWDEDFYEHTVASMLKHKEAWAVFARLDAVVDEYAMVVGILRDNGLPDVMAAIPYQESRYRSDAQSVECARGYWQFMPEVAHRVGRDTDLGFAVKDCAIAGVEQRWSPTRATPPKVAKRLYRQQVGDTVRCRIQSCRVDDREHLEKSTEAAAFSLREAWDDGDLAESGALVQLTILSHNAGYDDKRFGIARSTNLRPAFNSWKGDVDKSDWHTFYGDNITCDTAEPGGGKGRCGGKLPAETQHYAYTIVAQHLLAVCYYGQSYADKKEFSAWAPYSRGQGYCNGLGIPTSQEVQTR